MEYDTDPEINDFEWIEYNGIPVKAVYYGEESPGGICLTDICKHFGKRIDHFKDVQHGLNDFMFSKKGKGGGTWADTKIADHVITWCKRGTSLVPMLERLEIAIKPLIETIVTHSKYIPMTVIHQYEVSKYRIDFYIPELRIAIEYDEKRHKQTKEEDANREKVINAMMKDKLKFIRIEQGNELEGIGRLLDILNE